MSARLRAALAALALLLVPTLASAHERFIRHDLKHRMQDWFFGRDPNAMFGMNPNMLHIGILVTGLLAVLMGI